MTTGVVTAASTELPTKIRTMTCAAGTAIPVNTVLTMSDPRTVAEVAAAPLLTGYSFGGIAFSAKDASDASTHISVAVDGIWEFTASGAIAIGAICKSVGGGRVAAITNALDYTSGVVVGRCLETAADTEIVSIAVGSIV